MTDFKAKLLVFFPKVKSRNFSPFKFYFHCMLMHLRRSLLLLLGFGIFGNQLSAQEVLSSDANLPSKSLSSIERQAPVASRPALAALSLPFFDDFGYDSAQPDTNLWANPIGNLRTPGISTQKGNRVPSKGVATFDGARFDGRFYQSDLGSGINDTLASRAINLSGNTAADSIYLSFFVQRGGTGEAPEALDSLVLLFDSSGTFDYVQVWALKGTGTVDTAFQFFHVPVTASKFLHANFRFKFVCYASLNGELDQFHLDYVYLNQGRNISDQPATDLSPARLVEGPLYPFTAVPHKQYVGGGYDADISLLGTNVGAASMTFSAGGSIDDPVGGNAFSGSTSTSFAPLNIAPYLPDTLLGPAFGSQSANFGTFGAIRTKVIRTGGADAHASNDSLNLYAPIDSILAYDDGVSDFGYGLTVPRAFCQQYDIARKDTLVAIWIHFAPTIYYNPTSGQSNSLEGKGFRLVVWDTLGVDSSLVETSGGMNVGYGSSANEFIRFQLIREVEVPERFWVGLRQVDGWPIGVGFDKNAQGKRIYFENNLSEFQLSNNVGCLMIRPEFRNPATPLAIPRSQDFALLQFKVYPQPLQGNQLNLLLDAGQSWKDGEAELVDIQGRSLQAWSLSNNSLHSQLEVNRVHAAGIYFLKVRAKGANGALLQGTQKVIIQ